MANLLWRGDQAELPQIDTLTPTAAGGAGGNYDVLINTKRVRYTSVGADTVAVICAGLKALLAASEIPEFFEIEWTENGSLITGTGKIDGKPFTITTAVSGAGVGTLTQATTQNATGPKIWADSQTSAPNFSGGDGDAPSDDAGDVVYIENMDRDISYNLEVSSALGNALELHIPKSMRGHIGLHPDDTDGGVYRQYRPLALKLKANRGYLGHGEGQGSGFMYLDLSPTVAADQVIEIHGTGTPAFSPLKALQLLTRTPGANNTTVHIYGGSVGIAQIEGTSCEVEFLHISGNADVYIGPGVTISQLYIGGNARVVYDWRASDVDIIEMQNTCQLTLMGGVNPADGTDRQISSALNVFGGTLLFNVVAGTSANVVKVGSTGVIDARNAPSAGGDTTKMFEILADAPSFQFSPGAAVYDPNKKINFVNYDIVGGGMKDVTLDWGKDLRVSVNRD